LLAVVDAEQQGEAHPNPLCHATHPLIAAERAGRATMADLVLGGCLGSSVARLALINGAPGSGKSTLAHLLAQDEPLTLALDIDAVKHSLGQWRAAMPASGAMARRLAVAMVSEHVREGHDVIVGQFLARTDFISELEALAGSLRATWTEFVLSVNETELRARLAARAARPERPEHLVNSAHVSPEDVPQLVRSVEAVIALRLRATVIDANGTIPETAEILRRHLHGAQ